MRLAGWGEKFDWGLRTHRLISTSTVSPGNTVLHSVFVSLSAFVWKSQLKEFGNDVRQTLIKLIKAHFEIHQRHHGFYIFFYIFLLFNYFCSWTFHWTSVTFLGGSSDYCGRSGFEKSPNEPEISAAITVTDELNERI